MGKKIDDLLNKQMKKFKHKTGKSKKEKDLKKINNMPDYVDHLIFQRCKPRVSKGQGKLRTKGRQGVEGMFFKGLRSEYISRACLNEANEARKNEDINKIIDLGRIFQKKKEPPRKSLKGIAVCAEKSPECLGEISEGYNESSDKCPPSPISLVFTLKENCSRMKDASPKKCIFRQLKLEKEFAMFLSKYEETVGIQVLYKLPERGILEEAIEALKKVIRIGLNEPEIEKFRRDERELEEEFNFFKCDFETEKCAKADFFENFVSPEIFLVPERQLKYENYGEKSLGNKLMTTNVEYDRYHHHHHHPLFLPVLDNYDENEGLDVLKFKEKDFEKQTEDLNIATPPLHFYRRNMF